MVHKFPLGSFHQDNRTTFSEVPLFPEIVQWDEPKSHVPFTSQPEFPEFFGKWKTPMVIDNSPSWTEQLGNGLLSLTMDSHRIGARNSPKQAKNEIIQQKIYSVNLRHYLSWELSVLSSDREIELKTTSLMTKLWDLRGLWLIPLESSLRCSQTSQTPLYSPSGGFVCLWRRLLESGLQKKPAVQTDTWEFQRKHTGQET